MKKHHFQKFCPLCLVYSMFLHIFFLIISRLDLEPLMFHHVVCSLLLLFPVQVAPFTYCIFYRLHPFPLLHVL